VCLLEAMVACTLDYHWHRYVIAALVSLFSGVIVLLPIRLWQVYKHRTRQRRSTTAANAKSTLTKLRSGAEGILAGNSAINKIIVSLTRLPILIVNDYHRHNVSILYY